jgi:hypothetical protein
VSVNGTSERAGQLPELPSGNPKAQSALRANSVTPSSPVAVPRNSASPSSAGWLASLRGGLTRTDNLLDARRGSIRSTWSGHREAAARWEKTWYVMHARHAWGVVHLVIHTVLDVIDWITETFLRSVVAAALIYALIHVHWK